MVISGFVSASSSATSSVVGTMMMIWVAFIALQGVHLAQAVSFGFDSRVDVGLARRLQSRQSEIPNVPVVCKPSCDPVTTQIANGCTPTQCCTAQFETGYFNCFECVAETFNMTDFTTTQQILDDLVVECAQRGLSIPKLTFPGQDPNRPLTDVPISGSATASNFPNPSVSVPTVSSRTTITSVSLASPPSQSTVTQPPSSTGSPLFTQITVSNLQSTSSPGASPTSAQSSGSSFQTKDPILGIISTLLVGYWIVVA